MRVKKADGSWIEIGEAGDQVYSYEDATGTQFHWSVTAATAFGQAQEESRTVSLADMGVNLALLLRQYPDLDVLHAFTTDLSRPLIFVPIGEKVRLIDGWHRCARALLTGVDVLPAHILTQEEADASLILTLPPGRGVEWGQPRLQERAVAAPVRSNRALRRRK